MRVVEDPRYSVETLIPYDMQLKLDSFRCNEPPKTEGISLRDAVRPPDIMYYISNPSKQQS